MAKCPNCGKEGDPLGKYRAYPDLYRGEYFCRECSIQYRDDNNVSSKEDMENEEKEFAILENNKSKLFKDRFIHERRTYFISDMKKAVMISGFLETTRMEITFKDRTTRDFKVGTVSTSSNLNALLSGFMVDTMSQDLKVSTQQWVTAINMLIVNSSTEKIDESNSSMKTEIERLRKEIDELKNSGKTT
jgi:hypothetical protein